MNEAFHRARPLVLGGQNCGSDGGTGRSPSEVWKTILICRVDGTMTTMYYNYH